MTTISSDQYFDDNPRTAGETFTINNNAKFTIRTDTRVHANAPSGMTGSIGNVTIDSAQGGQLIIDATHVRWLAFSSASGDVPTIGTTITGGTSGATGYLLGIYGSLTSAPTSAGSSSPTTGWVKFREVTGAFQDDETISGGGWSATADGTDKVGWIEVVADQSATMTVPRLGKWQMRGSWFYLDDTNGTRGQILTIPTNGGGNGTRSAGVWIETSPNSGTYEFFPALRADIGGGFTTTNLGTDERSKFVQCMDNGQMRIGSDGTNNIGYLPPSGCKCRIPNIFLRQTSSTDRSLNLAPHSTLGTRPDFTTTGAGEIDIEYAYADWYFSFAQAYKVKLLHVATFDSINISECATALNLDDGGTGMHGNLDVRALLITSCFAGGTIKNFNAQRATTGSGDYSIELAYSSGQTLENVLAGPIAYARNNTSYAIALTQSTNITIKNSYIFSTSLYIASSSNIKVLNLDYCDRRVGTTDTTTGMYAIVTYSQSNGILVDGITFGLNGTIQNVHPYLGVLNCSATLNSKFRNLGSRGAFISGGSANNPAYIFASGGNNYNLKIQRMYMTPTRSGAISTTNSDKLMLYESIYGDFGDIISLASLDSVARGLGGTNTTTGQTSVYGTHFWDVFTSDTEGRIVLSLNENTEYTQNLVSLSGNAKFTSAGDLSMPTVNDQAIIEMSYYAKAHTSFKNIAPALIGTNTGNMTYEYQIDKNDGNGWNGTWKTLNGANLSSETGIDPSKGFKLKYRITTITANVANKITYIRVSTNSTKEAQTNYLYDLDVVNFNLNNIREQSRYWIQRTDTQEVVASGVVAGSGDALVDITIPLVFTGSGDIPIKIRVRKSSISGQRYQPFETLGSYNINGGSAFISQVKDTLCE